MLARFKPATHKWCALLQRYSSAPAIAPVADSWRNPAAVLHGTNDLRFEDHPLPDEVPSELVRVQMRSVGICGSDVHLLKQVSEYLIPSTAEQFARVLPHFTRTVQGRIGRYVVDVPTVMGHECSGYRYLARILEIVPCTCCYCSTMYPELFCDFLSAKSKKGWPGLDFDVAVAQGGGRGRNKSHTSQSRRQSRP